MKVPNDPSSTKDFLDTVGCGFCLAKWSQVTMHLGTGMTHSCHHPEPHKISKAEIERNPTALHNTRFKKLQRRKMLNNERPDECSYCWKVEDSSSSFSDRIYKSGETWSWPSREKIKTADWREDVNPTYVEVAFSNSCNFKCSYCGPQFSSTWMKEIEENGGYPTSTDFNGLSYIKSQNALPILHTEHNPYVEAFWKWWPDLYSSLHTFRITGGEPLMDKNTWDVLDFICTTESPNRNLELCINTNLGISDSRIEKLIDKINKISDENRAKSIFLFTSVDSWGKQAEYIRHGLDFNKFWDNINKVLTRCPTLTVTFMSTYNILSVPNYSTLIRGIYDLKREYTSKDRFWSIALDTSYLRWPPHQAIDILPKASFLPFIDEQVETAVNFQTPIDYYQELCTRFDPIGYGYGRMEIDKIKRLKDVLGKNENMTDTFTYRKDFYKFFSEHDHRRGTNFCETFPELEEFYRQCREL